jgi:hypothetical protein
VHFAGALVLSAIMSAPWHSYRALSLVLGMCGIGGIVYSAVVMYRAGHQSEYKPVWQDWVFYAVLPSAAYLALASGSVLLDTNTQDGLFVVAAVALALLLIGIHNAWDTVTHIISTARADGAQKVE